MLSKLHFAIHCALLGIIAWFAVDEYGLLWIEGDNAREARCRDEKAKIVQAGEEALRATIAAQAAETARQQRIKENADVDYQMRLAAAVRAARRYRAERLPAPAFGGSPGGSSAVPESADPRVPETAPADAELVSITAADLDACAADYAYAQSAFEWARTLGD